MPEGALMPTFAIKEKVKTDGNVLTNSVSCNGVGAGVVSQECWKRRVREVENVRRGDGERKKKVHVGGWQKLFALHWGFSNVVSL